MIIRHAIETDMPVIVGMSRRFYATTSYADIAPIDDDAVVSLATAMIDTGVLLVAEMGNTLVGMVGLMVVPFYFNRNVRTAHEVVWWVDPDKQGAGVGKALLAAVDKACIEAGAVAVQMLTLANSPPQASEMLCRFGYKPTESLHTKEL